MSGSIYNNPKYEFCSWASSWLTSADQNIVETYPTDLPKVVNLLKSLGYKMTRLDRCNPEDCFPLTDGSNGCKVVITCTHSGQRCVLEQSIEECSCSEVPDVTKKDCFWEVNASTPPSHNVMLAKLKKY